MKILVTGGAGFIGSHIVEALLEQGHQVVVVDDLSSGKRQNVPAGVSFHQVDIRDSELEEVFRLERPEVVSHQAARANVRESLEQPVLYADVNVVGSVNLLECCRKQGVRKVVYASTGGAVYGEPQMVPVSEDHPIHPLDPYGASKHHVEHYLELYGLNFGLDHTVLRYPNVYGPRQDPHGEAGVVAIFTGQMLRGVQPVINGTGKQERDFVFVRDVAHANVQALELGGGGIFNIGSGVGTSVNQIFNELARLTGFNRGPSYGSAKQGEVSRIFLNAEKAKRELAWQAEIPLEEGLSQTVASFR
jgi:UDP-glucose 4-epimerase